MLPLLAWLNPPTETNPLMRRYPPLRVKIVERVNLWATDGLLPSLTILLDLDPAAGRERVAGRADAPYDRLEDTGLDFAERVRAAYLALAEAEPDRFAVIDASADPDTVHRSVVSHVRAMLDAERPGGRTGR